MKSLSRFRFNARVIEEYWDYFRLVYDLVQLTNQGAIGHSLEKHSSILQKATSVELTVKDHLCRHLEVHEFGKTKMIVPFTRITAWIGELVFMTINNDGHGRKAGIQSDELANGYQ